MEVLSDEIEDKILQANSALLYPETEIGESPESITSMTSEIKLEQLVVLDASWRKSKRMLFSNPILQKLPRLSLSDTPPSQYEVRKSTMPGALSTLESVLEAYKIIEPKNDLSGLLKPFERMIQIQRKFTEKTIED